MVHFLASLLSTTHIIIMPATGTSTSKQEKLFDACRDGKTKIVRKYLNDTDHVIDINWRGGDLGQSALHAACFWDNVDIIKILLDHGADIDLPTLRYKNTPLMLACDYARLKTIKLLLNHGANVNARNNVGESPLHRACNDDWSYYVSSTTNSSNDDAKTRLECVEELIAYGADASIENKNGETALDIIGKKSFYNGSMRARFTTLLRSHHPQQQQNNNGSTRTNASSTRHTHEIFDNMDLQRGSCCIII